MALQGCGAFRVFNRDKSILGTHQVVITPCGWKLEDKFSGAVKDEQTGKTYFKYSCGETLMTIKDEELTVNGKSYGKLANEFDFIKIDGSKVFVNEREIQAVANAEVTGNGR
jgi:hypothetical protein